MDPDFLKAIMAMQAKIQSLKAQGVDVTGDNIDEYLKSATNGKFGLSDYRQLQGNTADNMIRSVGYGLSANHLDNILGLFSKTAADESKARQEAYTEYHPLHSLAGMIAGGAVTGKAMEPALEAAYGPARSVASAALHGVTAGAAYGGADAAGRADDGTAMDKLNAFGNGALGGALVGGTIGAGAAAGTSAVADRAATNRIVSAIQKEGGLDAVKTKLQSFVDAGRGDQVTLADLGPHLRAALDFAANGSDDVLVPATELLQARTAERAARLLSDVRANLGAPASLANPRPNMPPEQVRSGEPDFNLRQQQLEQNTSNVGDKVYGDLAAQNPKFDVSSLPLDKPLISSMWNKAKLASDINMDGSPIDELIQTLTKNNPAMKPAEIQQAAKTIMSASAKDAQQSGMAPAFAPTKGRPVTLDDMTSLYRALEGRTKAAFAAQGGGPLGNALSGVKTEVGNALEEGAPGFKAAQATYRGANDLERGNVDGHDWWLKADQRQLARVVQQKAAQPGALDEFRTGIASGLVEKLQSAATNQDVARQLTQASEDMSAKLKVIFGDAKTLDNFMARAKAENEMSKMSGAVYNSATARRLAARGINPSDMAVDAALQPTKAAKGVLSAIGGTAKNALNARTASQMGPSLLTQGAPNIQSLLSRLTGSPPLVSGAPLSSLPAGLMSVMPFLNNNLH